MPSTYQSPAQAMPTLTKVALRATVVSCVLLVISFPVMAAQPTIGILLVFVAFLAWLIASFCGLFGVARAQPKPKAINVLIFSLVGPFLTMLLMMVLLSLPRFFS